MIHLDASRTRFAWLRTWVVALWLVEVLRRPLPGLATLPEEAFVPLEVLERLSGGHPEWFLQPDVLRGLQGALLLTLILTLIPRVSSGAGVVAALLVTLHQALIRSFSYVFHAQLALLYALFSIVVVQACLSPVEKRGRKLETAWSIPFVATLAFLCLTYTFTGVYRLTHGGLELFFSSSLEFWLRDRPLVFDVGLGPAVLSLPGSSAALNLGFAVVTVFESLALLAIVSARFRLAFVAVVGSFHLATFALMGIAFWENLLLFPLFFDPTSEDSDRHSPKPRNPTPSAS